MSEKEIEKNMTEETWGESWESKQPWESDIGAAQSEIVFYNYFHV